MKDQSPWDAPMDFSTNSIVAQNVWTHYLELLSYFGLAILAVFGALFLSILFIIITSVLWEHRRFKASDSSDNDSDVDTSQPERKTLPHYNLHLPQNSTVEFYTSQNGLIRRLVARPQQFNVNPRILNRIRHSPYSASTSTDKILYNNVIRSSERQSADRHRDMTFVRSMEIQRPSTTFNLQNSQLCELSNHRPAHFPLGTRIAGRTRTVRANLGSNRSTIMVNPKETKLSVTTTSCKLI